MKKPENRISHAKAMLIGGGCCGLLGAFLGFMSGLTLKGAASGFLGGWLLGEIFGVFISESDS